MRLYADDGSEWADTAAFKVDYRDTITKDGRTQRKYALHHLRTLLTLYKYNF